MRDLSILWNTDLNQLVVDELRSLLQHLLPVLTSQSLGSRQNCRLVWILVFPVRLLQLLASQSVTI